MKVIKIEKLKLERQKKEIEGLLFEVKNNSNSLLEKRPAPKKWITEMKKLYKSLEKESKRQGNFEDFKRSRKNFQAICNFYFPEIKKK